MLANPSSGRIGRSTEPAGTFDEHRTPEGEKAPPQSNRSRNHVAAPAQPAAPNADTVDDIFGAFMSASSSDVPEPAPKPAAPAAPGVDARKAQILALYNTPAPRPPMMMQQPHAFDQQHHQSNPFASGWSAQPVSQPQTFVGQQQQPNFMGQHQGNWQMGGMAPMQPQGQFNAW